MRIAMVSKYYNKRQGIPRVVAELCEALSLDHEVHVYTREWECEDPRVRFHRVPSLEKESIANELLFFFQAGRALRRRDYDIAHIHDPCFYPKGIFTSHAFVMGGVRTFHELFKVPRLLRPLRSWRDIAMYPLTNYNMKSRGSEGVIAVSGLIKDLIVRHAKVAPERISVIHNGVDLDRFRPDGRSEARARIRSELGIASGDFVICFVGHYLDRKGLALVFEATKRIGAPRIKILIVGQRAEESPYINSMLGAVIPREQAIFVGARDNVEDYMNASDMLALPALYEPFGNVALEAMACGLPVVVSSHCGAAELIDDGVNGAIIDDPRDAGELARRIREICESPPLATALGERALRTARSRSWSAVVEETSRVYEHALLRRRGAKGERLQAR